MVKFIALYKKPADVDAFALVSWHSGALPERFARKIIDTELTIEGLQLVATGSAL